MLWTTLNLKWHWAGHMARVNDGRWTELITKWTPNMGKQKAGKPKRKWTDEMVDIDRKICNKMEETFTALCGLQYLI